MKAKKITYYISTGLLTLVMLFSATMYLFNNGMVREVFTALGYPVYIIYPLAIAKIAGLLTIHFSPTKVLKQLAYAGFFYNLILAVVAHVMVGDGGFVPALVVLIAVITSYVTSHKI